MSRIIVKNLPNKIKEQRLREVFGARGEVTDCALKYTKDGVFRKFAFVGFKTEEEAQAAIKQFNNSYLDTTRIQIQLASGLGDSSKPRSWSKYAADSSAYKNETEKKKDEGKSQKNLSRKEQKKLKKEKKKKAEEERQKEMLGELYDNQEFEEFLGLHQARNKKSAWSNDTQSVSTVKKMVEANKKEESDGGKDASLKEEHEGDEAVTDIPTSSGFTKEKKGKGVALKAEVSDLEYLKSKVKSSFLDDESEDSDDSDDGSDTDVESIDNASSDASETSQESENDEEITCEDSTVAAQKEVEETKLESSGYDSEHDKEEKAVVHYLVKMRGVPVNVSETQIKEFFRPLKIKEMNIPKNAKGNKTFCVASIEFHNEDDQLKAMGRNKNFIGPKKVFLHKTKQEEKIQIKPTSRTWEFKKHDEDDEVEPIGESGRLYVRNLAYSCTEEDIEALFSEYGPLTEVHLPIDSFTKKKKGFAFVTFLMSEHAVTAFTKLDGSVFQGRMLHILPSKEKRERKEEITESTPYHKKKELKQKALASSSHNWNTLFLGANAVADVMAEKYQTAKSNILDADQGGSLGVRMALGETQIVTETREFLIEEGVTLDAFSQADGERSKTVLLVKNLPAKTGGQELRDLFSRHGDVGRVVLPPSGVTAIIEYLEPTEARAGFRSLAYTKFKHVPLYLEWAPMAVFKKPAALKAGSDEEIPNKPNKLANKKETAMEIEEDEKKEVMEEEEEEEEDVEPDSVLFVKNLNFDTTEEALNKMFSACGKLKSATIAQKKDPKQAGHMLSMGYGFLEFYKRDSAQQALRTLQHATLDGHQLELKQSNRQTVEKASTRKKKQNTKLKQKSSKILIRNIPFEAKTKELSELFGVFGEVKSVRLPKKLGGTGTHRGFGFVDFLNKADAKRAFNSLCHSTHLYGRRLVLEWADSEESVDELRLKTAKRYHDGPASKRLKKSTLMADLTGTA